MAIAIPDLCEVAANATAADITATGAGAARGMISFFFQVADLGAKEMLKTIAANTLCCTPVNPHSFDAFEARGAGFVPWQDRDKTRWPQPA